MAALSLGAPAQFGFPDQLTTRLTINLTSSANSPEVSNSTFTGTVNWSNNAIDGVYVDSIADDMIIGNAAANQLIAKGGEDSDDTIKQERATTGSVSRTSPAETRWIAGMALTPSSQTPATR